MLHTCPRCRRANPADAQFCYNDGATLGDPSVPHADPARRRFHTPFVFPSGGSCHTFDELALAVVSRWEESRQLLSTGVFAGFMAGLGRGDLSMAARTAAREADPDRGLDDFLARLPSSVVKAASVSVDPVAVNLGTLRPGQDVRFNLHLANSGMGLVSGSVTASDAPWLVVGDANAKAKAKVVQFRHDLSVPVQVNGKALSASQKPFRATLTVETNGGTLEVPVAFEVPVTPFPEGVLAGAVTPRQIAERARDNSKGAADLFVRGLVAKWYEANGWTYPVQDRPASGVAAIQQYFEALGVTAPPAVSIDVTAVPLQGRVGERLTSEVVVTTAEKKPVFASAVSDADWLTIGETVHEGRSATVPLVVAAVPPGQASRSANVVVLSNGRKKFRVKVTLDVNGPLHVAPPAPPAEPAGLPSYLRPPEVRVQPAPVSHLTPVLTPVDALTLTPVLTPVADPDPPDPADATPERRPPSWLPLLPVAFLALGLMVTLGRDLIAMRSPIDAPGGPGGVPQNMPQVVRLYFHDEEMRVNLAVNGSVKPGGGGVGESYPAFWEPSMRFGLTLADEGPAGRKKLTFEPKGLTNNAVVMLDGEEALFGDRPFRRASDGQYEGNWPGRWLDRNGKPDSPMRDGRKSSWIYDAQKVVVTQTVGLVPGSQSDRVDTCLVKYRIENRDARPHRVGLRFMLDTYIGGNDGVPFLIPGRSELCSTRQEFNAAAEIPDFIQARETADLERPGTVAFVQLKLPGGEPPSRVTLGAWPNTAFRGACRQEKTGWHVPVFSMKEPTPEDSCVVIYWNEVEIPPGKYREVGFAYGLGSVSNSEAGGMIAMSVGGSFVPGGEFTVTAEIREAAGKAVTLALPPGFEAVGTELRQTAPPAGANGISPLTWRVKAGPAEGTFDLRARVEGGPSQAKSVRIRTGSLFGR